MKIIVLVCLLAILALVVCLAPLKTVAYTVVVDYQDTETYFVSEPYQDTETYYEDAPLNYQVVNSYDDKGSYQQRNYIVLGGVVVQDKIITVYYPVGHIVIKNIDDTAGEYGIKAILYAVDKDMWLTVTYSKPVNYDSLLFDFLSQSHSKQVTATIQPGESKEITFEFKEVDTSKDYYKWEYEVTPGTKPIEKERTVTKYRQVEKERTVTKQRPETRYKKATLLDYLLHY